MKAAASDGLTNLGKQGNGVPPHQHSQRIAAIALVLEISRADPQGLSLDL